MSYLYEKLYVTISCLAEGKGDVRSRLRSAHISALSRLFIRDIPKEFQKDWGKYVGRLTKYPPVTDHGIDYSGLDNSLRRMKNKTGQKIAKFLFDLFIIESEKINNQN